ncbi:hypothetical protein IPA_08290 [Ignicoccus pacificus DSM 13166]|uniref:Ribosomal RNA large subunit methyltransferase K/L-like methyltransferase domain-containing protein n=1 Tax=Ignicoccus pacificus DSM 13166 TaxID=940294 RepID=A0A977KBY4_9CREN|nr:hypothetical protein IPA_08290 [Ignicoccus pacificus DSM 13166]
METLYFVLSGAHRTIPFEEVRALHEAEECPLRVLSEHFGLVLAEGDPECSSRIMYRSAFVKEVGEVFAIGDDVGVSVFKDFQCSRYHLRKLGGLKVPRFEDLLKGEGICRIVVTEGFYLIGRTLAKRKEGKSKKGPFFSPGSMDPILARAMVNLSRLKRGGTFLDPFCGTAVYAIEASKVAGRTYCSDLDPAMCYGGRINTQWAGVLGDNILSDSYYLPFRNSSIQAIATDPPYGRSVVSLAHRPEELLLGFLERAYEVLKPGSWIAFASSSKVNVPEVIASTSFELGRCHVQRVHRSLARLICTARKP